MWSKERQWRQTHISWYISTEKDDKKDELCGMPEILLDDKLGKEDKFDRLESEYDMKKTAELEGGITKMCDYSIGIARDNYRNGIEEGKKEGQSLLVKAIQMLREGKKEEDILKDGVDEETLELAKACR